jgi:hypothetical protein
LAKAELWLVPPLLKYTPFIYMGFTCIWLPTLIICWCLLRPIGTRLIPILLVVAGVPLTLATMWVFLTWLYFNFLFFLSPYVTCQSNQVSAGRVFYTCLINDPNFSGVGNGGYLLEVSPFSPFLKVRDQSTSVHTEADIDPIWTGLNGFNPGIPLSEVKPAETSEDCVTFNPEQLEIMPTGTDWLLAEKLTDGRLMRMALLQTKADADKALAVARQYTRQCFIGRDNTRLKRLDYIVQYWQGNSGLPTAQPQGNCFPYYPDSLRLKKNEYGDPYWMVEAGSSIAMLANHSDAEKTLTIARQHTARCYIGVDNSYPAPQRKYYILEYWK